MNYPPPPPPPGFPPNPGGPGAFGPPPGPPGGGGYGGGGNYGGGGGGGFGPPPPPPFMGQSGSDWDVGEVLQSAWEAFKVCWGPLVGALFLSAFASGIVSQISSFIGQTMMGVSNAGHRGSDRIGGAGDLAVPMLAIVIMLVGSILGWAIGCFFHVGMTRMWCSAARRESVDFGELFRGGNRFLHLLAAQFLVFIAVFFASLLLFVPGIILSYGLMLTQFYVVDAEMGPIEAMKASWETTTGQKGKLFVLSLAFFALAIAGLLCCCLGIYVAAPVCSVALAIVYVRLSGRMGAGGGMGGMGGIGGPPPGFGPPPAAFGPPPGAFGPPPPAGGFGGGGGGGYGPPGGGGGYGPPGGGGGGYGPPR